MYVNSVGVYVCLGIKCLAYANALQMCAYKLKTRNKKNKNFLTKYKSKMKIKKKRTIKV